MKRKIKWRIYLVPNGRSVDAFALVDDAIT